MVRMAYSRERGGGRSVGRQEGVGLGKDLKEVRTNVILGPKLYTFILLRKLTGHGTTLSLVSAAMSQHMMRRSDLSSMCLPQYGVWVAIKQGLGLIGRGHIKFQVAVLYRLICSPIVSSR